MHSIRMRQAIRERTKLSQVFLKPVSSPIIPAGLTTDRPTHQTLLYGPV